MLDSLINEVNIDSSDENRIPLLNYFRRIETGGFINKEGETRNKYGDSSLSPRIGTAKGVYQFNNPTIRTLKRRAKNIGIDKKWIKNLSNNPRKWTDGQADIVTLINLFSRELKPNESTYYGVKGGKGVIDSLLKRAIIDKDKTAATDLFLTLHYQKRGPVDRETLNRVKKIKYP